MAFLKSFDEDDHGGREIVRLLESDPVPVIRGFIPENDSMTQLAPRSEGGESGSGNDERRNDDSPSFNSEDDEQITAFKPLTISSGSTGDADIPMPDISTSDCLTKTELMQFIDDPYWKRIRLLLFIAFWLVWFTMIVAAAIILVISPKCPPVQKLVWWQKTPLYRVKTDLFFDASGDGVGDFEGLTEKLDYIQGLNVKGILLDDIFQGSTAKVRVDERLGTTADFDTLIKLAHKKGMFVVLDVDPTTVSIEDDLFQTNKGAGSDVFRWSGESVDMTWSDGRPAWAEDTSSGRFYLHAGDPKRPVLNLNDPLVKTLLDNFFETWLSKGVDGFCIRGLEQLAFEKKGNVVASTNSLVENLDVSGHAAGVVESWRHIFDAHVDRTHRPRLLMLDVSTVAESPVDFEVLVNAKGADVLLVAEVATKMLDFPAKLDHCDSTCLKRAVDVPHEDLPSTSKSGAEGGKKIKWRANVVGGSTLPRFAARMERNFFNAYLLVLGLLPGTPVFYYGDEVGMLDPPVGVAATPMQWTGDPKTAGFTSSKTGAFVPLAPSHETINVQMQRALGSDHNNLHVFAEAMKLRREPSIAWGKIFESSMDNQIYSYLRQARGYAGYLVAVNAGTSPSLIDFVKPSLRLPAFGVVVLSTANFRHHEFAEGTRIRLDKVYLRPGQGVVVKLEEEVVQYDVVVNGQ